MAEDYETIEKLIEEGGKRVLLTHGVPDERKSLSGEKGNENNNGIGNNANGERTRERSAQKHSQSRSRGRSPNRRHRKRSRSHGTSEERPAYRRRRSPSLTEEERAERRESERKRREAELRAEEQERVRRENEEARRDDLTVLFLNLSLKVDERDVYEFATKHAGKVRDIQVIRDQRSGKSKGVAYVEFYTQEALIKSLSLTGSQLKGMPLRVQASQAEKNRAARAAKQLAAEQAAVEGALKLYVGNLVDELANITVDELRELFGPFGTIDNIDLHKDPYTGFCKGYAFIQFRQASEAKEAMTAMNGFPVTGNPLKVGLATESKTAAQLQHTMLNTYQIQAVTDSQDTERLDDAGGGLLSGSTSKIELMKKLQRDVVAPRSSEKEMRYISKNLRLKNMFSPIEIDLAEDPNFFTDVTEDVLEECSAHGPVVQVWIDEGQLDGCVWVKMQELSDALKVAEALGGRFFGGKRINVEFVSDIIWENTVCAK